MYTHEMNQDQLAHAWISREAGNIAHALQADGQERIDLTEWRSTPAGGFWDGGIISSDDGDDMAHQMLMWHRPLVAVNRARAILGWPPLDGMPASWKP